MSSSYGRRRGTACPVARYNRPVLPRYRSHYNGDDGKDAHVNLHALQPGDQARTIDGDTVEIVAPTQDGQWIRVRYLASPHDPELVGMLDLCHVDEFETIITADRPAAGETATTEEAR